MSKLPASTIQWVFKLHRQGIDHLRIGRRAGLQAATVARLLAGEEYDPPKKCGRPRKPKITREMIPVWEHLTPPKKVKRYRCQKCNNTVIFEPCLICRTNGAK